MPCLFLQHLILKMDYLVLCHNILHKYQYTKKFNGTEVCSDELLEEICRKQEERYTHGEISRKYYRSFVTAAFRIRSYVNTGVVDFSLVKNTKLYKPGAEYQELIDSALKETGVSQNHQYKLGIIMRQFLCYYEKSHKSISEITDRDFIEFIPVVAKKNPII